MTIHEILEKFWGYPAFRPMQEDIIRSVLGGKDTLALLPTGGGKSICFQVPGLAKDGLCIVVSPLIALMKDQVYNLQRRGIKASAIYSGMSSYEITRNLDNCAFGQTKFLYVSPERLQTEQFLARLPQLNISLIAIDEAHCISQWGYDFRPAYLKIAQIREKLPDVPVLALTATATNMVKADIQEKLKFRKQASAVFQKSFTRANLSYSVFREEHKLNKLISVLQKVPGCGIVYVRSRKETQDVASALVKQGIGADFYHAGLDPQTRNNKQDRWIKNQIRVMVCTNAFGMGIDKPDVRVVVHLDLPESIEAYYQEAGRAGRDEKKSYAVLLYNNEDIAALEENLKKSFPPIEQVRQTYHLLCSYLQIAIGAAGGQCFDFDVHHFLETAKIPASQLFYSLKVLEENGYIAYNDALLLPSRLLVKMDKEQLYEVQVSNPRLEPYLKGILRTYGGVFDHYTEISETQLARNLKTTVEYVRNALTVMHRNQIIDYVPQTDKPQLVFTLSRTPAENLQIDTKLINFRKKVRQGNIQEVAKYAQNALICRSQQLVAYFGELDSNACGVCDVCLQKKKLAMAESRAELIATLIKKQLNRGNQTISALVTGLSAYKEDEVLKVLRWMTDNGQLLYHENEFSLVT
ncbi:RecQ family ATP-dependent DNA helicase [Sphingobacteriales bacterium UPWRP_1]|nr:recombinase RecQ [Sphingobacteriales bacterium TSM_CSS]PSJ71602.1 RecQ family ATP-dependent DNA helicase [Sphingobacteriales bacterium UPWRP_1]